MQINGKELKLFYSVGAKCDIDAKMLAADAPDLATYMAKYGGAAADVLYAEAMSRAYCEANGGEPVTEAELKSIPFADLSLLDAEVAAALGIGQEITVEAEPEKKAKRTSK